MNSAKIQSFRKITYNGRSAFWKRIRPNIGRAIDSGYGVIAKSKIPYAPRVIELKNDWVITEWCESEIESMDKISHAELESLAEGMKSTFISPDVKPWIPVITMNDIVAGIQGRLKLSSQLKTLSTVIWGIDADWLTNKAHNLFNSEKLLTNGDLRNEHIFRTPLGLNIVDWDLALYEPIAWWLAGAVIEAPVDRWNEVATKLAAPFKIQPQCLILASELKNYHAVVNIYFSLLTVRHINFLPEKLEQLKLALSIYIRNLETLNTCRIN